MPSLTLRWSALLPALLSLTLSLGAAGCAQIPSSAESGCSSSAAPCLDGQALVELDTERGTIRVLLRGEEAPLTAGNFLDLVQRGVYDGTVFHRVVRDPAPFVVQGGDPASKDPSVPPERYGTGSFIDPDTAQPRLIPLEVSLEGEEQPRYGEIVAGADQARQLRLTHERGAVAMARSQDPNSASAQFYVALQPLPELDGRYAVFGEVVEGMDVVDAIQQGDRITATRVIEAPAPAAD
ncbi:peptidylprolyl isomerase [Synechococcus sp. RSCCF101]|uniref:peptidylprolyl isomerase n=1 Tax=Synechococcus sp. RSCCF101 TaxID=2511069 RepID=UPI001245CECF|nr:peptidylprolyl isomerase [Synechococcus sp. RSCCF101]QEY31996.1 peptidylprolyl isomerase [Synechococcus sp. RSCCF101]